MKKLLLVLCFLFICSTAHAQDPKFKVHVIKDSKLAGVNYSINTLLSFDYDLDGDFDLVYISKEGIIFILENLKNE